MKFGDEFVLEFGDKFGESPNLGTNMSPNLGTNLGNPQIWGQICPQICPQKAREPIWWMMLTKLFSSQAQPDSQESLLCMTGGVLSIICGSSLVKFSSLMPAFFKLWILHIIETITTLPQVNLYEPLVSSASYPRSAGLALASFHVITGVLLIANSFLVLCTKTRCVNYER